MKRIPRYLGGYIAFSLTVFEASDLIFSRIETENDYFNEILILLIIGFFIGLSITIYPLIINKEKTIPKASSSIKSLSIALSVILLGTFSYYGYKIISKDSILEDQLPEIIDLAKNNNKEAYKKIIPLLQVYPENKILLKYYEEVTDSIEINTNYDNVNVQFKFSNDTTSVWQSLGNVTNLKRVPFTRIDLRFQVNGKNFESKFQHPYFLKDGYEFKLPESDEIPENHVLIVGTSNSLSFPGLDHLPEKQMNSYSISKYEVSNKEYKEFLDSEEYNDPNYWPFPFNLDGKILSFSNAQKLFVDKYGNPGPSNWEVGSYPNGKGNNPVSGISWFEAFAYAKFKGQSLPDIYQWENVAFLSRAFEIIPNSNFNRENLLDIENLKSENFLGLHNLAGNVREWAMNPDIGFPKNRAILGGSFLDETYLYNDFYTQSVLDRSDGNGIRLVYNFNEKEDQSSYGVEVRDFINSPDVTDEVFEYYLSQFSYESDSKFTTKKIAGTEEVIVEKYEVKAPYGSDNEILSGYVFFNKKFQKKGLKPIIFFPGSNALNQSDENAVINNIPNYLNYLLNSGYAIIHPIYKSTYSRQDEQRSDYGDMTDQYKNHVIMWGKDYKRSIDYIFEREDFNVSELSYMGVSWGGFMGNILLAIDKRVKAGFLLVAGLEFQKCKKEVDAMYYTRRIEVPTLMMNGRYDQYFPLETSQKPMFDLINLPPEKKKHYVYDSGHFVPRQEQIKFHLDWLNKFLTN